MLDGGAMARLGDQHAGDERAKRHAVAEVFRQHGEDERQANREDRQRLDPATRRDRTDQTRHDQHPER